MFCYPTCRIRAEDAVEGLIALILDKGVPKSIGSDRGVHFINSLFSRFCTQYRITHNIHCAYRPQSSGALERVHRTIKNSLWILSNELSIEWDEALMYAKYAHNVAYNAATKTSPYFAVYGRNPENLNFNIVKYKDGVTPLENGNRVATILEKAHAALKIAQNDADKKFESRNNPKVNILPVKVGDEVFLKRDQQVAAKSTHLNWVGPFKVTKVHDCVLEILKDDKGTTDYVHRSHCVLKIRREAHLIKCNDNGKSDVQGSIKTGEEMYEQSLNCDKTERISYRDIAAKTPEIDSVEKPSFPPLGRTRAATKKLQEDAAAEQEDAVIL